MLWRKPPKIRQELFVDNFGVQGQYSTRLSVPTGLKSYPMNLVWR